jgi:hypothetical protein
LTFIDVFRVRSKKIIVMASKVSETIKVLGEDLGWDVEWATARAVGWRLKALRFEAGRDSTQKRDRSRTMEGEAFVELCQGYGLVKLDVSDVPLEGGSHSENIFSDPTYKTSKTSESSDGEDAGGEVEDSGDLEVEL